jgi:hypothetical protein
VVLEAKTEQDLFAGHPNHFYLLQSAIEQVSYRLWEDLWNDKHPDCFGQAWEGENFGLMTVWREKVRSLLKECGQEAALAMTSEQYVVKLIAAGADEQAAEDLEEWLSEVTCETEGSTGST